MEIEQTLRMALAPREPAADFEDVVMARVSAAAWRASQVAPRRILPIGIVLVAIAAAAAMLFVRLMAPGQKPSTQSAPMDLPREVPPVRPVTDATSALVERTGINALAAREADRESGSTQPVAVTPHRYTVRVLPLRMQTNDPQIRAAIQENYDRIVAELRAIPMFQLVTPESPAGATPEPSEFRFTFIGADENAGRRSWNVFLAVDGLRANLPSGAGAGARMGGELMVRMYPALDLATLLPAQPDDAAYTSLFWFNSAGILAPDCGRSASSPGQSGKDCSPAASAAQQLEILRLLAFPADPALERRVQQRVVDRNVPWDIRYAAIRLLAQVRQSGRGAGLNAELVSGALDVIAGSPDTRDRAVLWRTLKGGLDLLGPPRLLVDAAWRESDEQARVEAVKLLAEDFAADTEVRTALESMSRADTSALVRNIARNAVVSDTEWPLYAAATVEDATLTPAQRIEPLQLMLRSEKMPDAATVLDRDVVRALTEVLPRLISDPATMPNTGALLQKLGHVETDGVVELLIACVHAGDARSGIARLNALNALVLHAGNPRAVEELESIAMNDPDELLRKRAAEALQAVTESQSPTR